MTKTNFCYITAKYLALLKPFVAYARQIDPLRFLNGNIGIEPCVDGGVYIVAVTAHAMAVIHDRDGYAREPVTVDIPDAAFKIAKGPAPIAMTYCGTNYSCPLPEWAQPEDIYLYDAGMHISTRMRNPDWADEHDEFHPTPFSCAASSPSYHRQGLDYRMRPGMPSDWRRPLQRISAEPLPPAEALFFNPTVPALFADLIDFFHAADHDVVVSHQPVRHTNGDIGPVIIRASGHPEFVGMWMPTRSTTVDPIPAHFLIPAATHEGTEGKQ